MSSIPQKVLIHIDKLRRNSLFISGKKTACHCLLVPFLVVFSQLLSSSLSIRSQRHLITWSFLPQLVAIATAPAVHTRISAQGPRGERGDYMTDRPEERTANPHLHYPWRTEKWVWSATATRHTKETENQAQCHTEVLNKSLLQLPDHPVVMENQVDLDLGC